MDDLKTTYDRIAADWDRDHERDEWWRAEIGAFLSRVQPGGSILDLGCGPGHKSKYFADLGYAVTGVDISDEMIRLARQRAPSCVFDALDMYELPALGQTFDAVFACASLLHIPKKDAEHIMLNIASVLKPGGIAYVSVKEQREGEAAESIVDENDYGYEYSRFFSYFTAAELRGLFERAHMNVVHEAVTSTGKTNWLVAIGQKS